jgi:hypothetical protein
MRLPSPLLRGLVACRGRVVALGPPGRRSVADAATPRAPGSPRGSAGRFAGPGSSESASTASTNSRISCFTWPTIASRPADVFTASAKLHYPPAGIRRLASATAGRPLAAMRGRCLDDAGQPTWCLTPSLRNAPRLGAGSLARALRSRHTPGTVSDPGGAGLAFHIPASRYLRFAANGCRRW